MKEIKVSKEFIEEFNKLKEKWQSTFMAMEEIGSEGKYPTLYNYLFENYTTEEDNNNLVVFGKIWTGEIKLEVKESSYIVWVKGSKTEKGWADFMVVEDDVNVIDINYDNRFDMAKEDSSFHFSKEDAFKLRDTGFFEIEEVD